MNSFSFLPPPPPFYSLLWSCPPPPLKVFFPPVFIAHCTLPKKRKVTVLQMTIVPLLPPSSSVRIPRLFLLAALYGRRNFFRGGKKSKKKNILCPILTKCPFSFSLSLSLPSRQKILSDPPPFHRANNIVFTAETDPPPPPPPPLPPFWDLSQRRKTINSDSCLSWVEAETIIFARISGGAANRSFPKLRIEKKS